MKECHQELDVGGLSVVSLQAGTATLRGPKGTILQLKNSEVYFDRAEGEKIAFFYRPSFRRQAKALKGTWTSALSRLKQDRQWKYRVTAIFKHFPVSMILGQDKQSIRVLNYYGTKTTDGRPREFIVNLPRVTITLIDPRTVVLTSRDRVHVGNMAAKFYNLRYKVHARNMDRRVFSDGFMIELDD